MKAAGIRKHPLFRLGKAAPRRDARNFKFAAILRAPAKLPPTYDFDLGHRDIPTPMFANDVYGDCVIAGRAHQTLRFELIEQGSPIAVGDRDVVREYFRETGGPDTGLVVLDSLKLWRQRGWPVGAGAAKRTYRIKAFTELAPLNHGQVKQAIYLDIGVGIGLSLPLSAQDQVQSGMPWDVVSGPAGRPGSWGGHYVFVGGWQLAGPVCVTWGRKQLMTWAFFDRYCDEAYGILDAMDRKNAKKALDLNQLRRLLAAL